MIGNAWLNKGFCLELAMHNKGKIFVCPYGKFSNRVMAAKAAASQGLPNAFNKLIKLTQTDPLNYYYESASSLSAKDKNKKKSSRKQNKLETITLANGKVVGWEEFSLWSKVKQETNLIPRTKEVKDKIRNATVERWKNDEYRSRLREKHVGRVFSDESKLKQSNLGGSGIMTPKGKFPSIRAASRAFNVSDSALRNWLWKSKTNEFYIAK